MEISELRIDLLRDEILKTSDVLVVKVGTNVLTHSNGMLNRERIDRLIDALAKAMKRGHRTILVSSGAVSAGLGRLGLKKRPHELPKLQAVAAIGQCELMEAYEQSLSRYDLHAGQVLLTAEDISTRKRYLNARNTFHSLLKYGALPIVNENDTVSVEELRTTFGDNDRLASLLANLFDTPLLVLLTDVDGLYDRDPSSPDAKLVTLIEHWTPELMEMVVEKRSARSKGGMSSKLKAAKIVTESGGNTIIANGDTDGILERILDSESVGTLFIAQGGYLTARKRWIGFAVPPTGSIVLDEGAIKAVCEGHKSLLPVGILNCKGSFSKGDVVSLVDTNGNERARGLSNYSMRDILLIRGRKTREIRDMLGHCLYEEVVHHDNLQVID